MMWQSSPLAPGTYNPFAPEVRENPYPYYQVLRRETPVCWIERGGFYAVTRYADVCYVLQHPELFSSSIMSAADTTLLGKDPPAHTWARRIINPCFSARRLAVLTPRIREVTAQLIARIVAQGACELMADLAAPLPVTIIAEMLGVSEERLDDFKRWSDAIIIGATGMLSPEQRREVATSAMEFREFFAQIIEERQKEQSAQSLSGDDLIGTLICANGPDAKERLTAEEALSLTMLLLIAGNETTTNLIGNAVLALLRHPSEMERVRDDLSLIPSLVEEVLRYDSPLQHLRRQAVREVELAGTIIPAGAQVVPMLGSANRDESQFPEPDRFDVTRNAHGHVAFGVGVHVCLGQSLARLEAQIALQAILSHLQHLRLKGEQITYVNSIQVRGPERLFLLFDPT